MFILSCGSKEDKQEYVDDRSVPSTLDKNDNKNEIKQNPVNTNADTSSGKSTQIDRSKENSNKTFERTFKPVAEISPLEAGEYEGKDVTVKGFVADVYKSEKVAYLNFIEKFPRNPFTAVIFASRFASFKDIDSYERKTVEVTGRVSQYKGKPQIILDSESQIKIVK